MFRGSYRRWRKAPAKAGRCKSVRRSVPCSPLQHPASDTPAASRSVSLFCPADSRRAIVLSGRITRSAEGKRNIDARATAQRSPANPSASCSRTTRASPVENLLAGNRVALVRRIALDLFCFGERILPPRGLRCVAGAGGESPSQSYHPASSTARPAVPTVRRMAVALATPASKSPRCANPTLRRWPSSCSRRKDVQAA